MFTSFLLQENGVSVYKIPQWYVIVALVLDGFILQSMLSFSHKQKLIDDCVSQSYEIFIGTVFVCKWLKVLVGTTLLDLRDAIRHQLVTQSQKLRCICIGVVPHKVPKLENDQQLKANLRMFYIEETTLISLVYGVASYCLRADSMANTSDFVPDNVVSNDIMALIMKVELKDQCELIAIFSKVDVVVAWYKNKQSMKGLISIVPSHYLNFSYVIRAKLIYKAYEILNSSEFSPVHDILWALGKV